jgi:hypothetical protein
MFAGVGIATVFDPPVILAFANGAGSLQHGNRPTTQRSVRRSSFVIRHQHERLPSNESLPSIVVPNDIEHFRIPPGGPSLSKQIFRSPGRQLGRLRGLNDDPCRIGMLAVGPFDNVF